MVQDEGVTETSIQSVGRTLALKSRMGGVLRPCLAVKHCDVFLSRSCTRVKHEVYSPCLKGSKSVSSHVEDSTEEIDRPDTIESLD
jgi:hypothetical protein